MVFIIGTDYRALTIYEGSGELFDLSKRPIERDSFTFVVRTDFDSKVRYDQSGIIMYLDSDNWLKAAMEYENEKIQRLGSVVTNNGYSDWAWTYS